MRRCPQALAGREAPQGPVLIARELAKSFGGIRAVADADIVVEDRTLHALIGPNGAGKTTAFNLRVRHVPARSRASSRSPASRSPG